MAHSYPPGEQARWNELERRILLSDVDIKRLWKAMPQGDITSPVFDGAIPEPPDITPHPILIYVTGVTTSTASSSYDQARDLHDAEFADPAITTQVVGGTSGPTTGADDLEQYKLIYIFHDRTGSFPSWIDPTATGNWLAGGKQRRLVMISELLVSLPGTYGAEVNSYLASLGLSLALSPATSGPPSSTANAGSYYLTSGLSTLTFTGTSFAGGGTLLYRWNGTTPGDMMHIASMGSGAEVILAGDSAWARTHSAANATFIKRLFPYSGYGGMLIP